MKCGRVARGYVAGAEESKTYLCEEHLFPTDVLDPSKQEQQEYGREQDSEGADPQSG